MIDRARQSTGMLLLFGALVGLAFAPLPGHAQQSTAETPPAAQQSESSEGTSIQVHGHWILEVRNPDGSLVERREFDNALEPSGAATLAQVLSGLAPSSWIVEFGTASGPCVGNACAIVMPGSDFAGDYSPAPSNNLSVEATGANNDVLTLSGSETADDSGQIRFVRTILGFCKDTTEPGQCDAQAITDAFTEKDLSSPVDVSAGQSVSVTVEISFSSG